MLIQDCDAMAAIATSSGKGAIGILRLSGESAWSLALGMFRKGSPPSPFKGKPIPRQVYYGEFFDPETENLVDRGLALFFKGPASYTGEDLVEFHVHGNPVLLNELLRICIRRGARAAEAGEFTRKALLNGKMNLLEAESVGDIINAESIEAVRLSNITYNGLLQSKISSIREALLNILASIEVEFDYPEESLDPVTRPHLEKELKSLLISIDNLMDEQKKLKFLEGKLKICLIGSSNTGKSSLLNRLLGKERAIVSETPGTTRDVVDEWMEMDGMMVKLMDTAGIRHSDDVVESIGVKKTWETLKEADFVIHVLAFDSKISDQDMDVLKETGDKPGIMVINKSDLRNSFDFKCFLGDKSREILEVSAKFGHGMDEFWDGLIKAINELKEKNRPEVFLNDRHVLHLMNMKLDIQKALNSLDAPMDLIAIDLRAALNESDLITGESATDDLLDTIFRTFCVGK